MTIYYLYNPTGSEIALSDVGLYIPSLENYEITLNELEELLSSSADLEAAITNGNIVVTEDSGLPPATQLTVDEALQVVSAQTYAEEVIFNPDGLTYISSDDVQNALQEVDTAISNTGADDNTLDEAYDQGASGGGRTITVDAGPVQLDSTTGDYSPLELTNRSTVPATDLAAGQVVIVDNILYTYDGARGKWLSTSKLIGFGRAGSVDGAFLLGPGSLGTQNSGWTMPRDGTVISAAGSSSGGNTSKGFVFGINGATTISSNFVNGAILNQNINIDFNAGDNMQIYILAAGDPIDSPEITIEIAWRI